MKLWIPLLCSLSVSLPAIAQPAVNRDPVAVAAAPRQMEITLPRDQVALIRDQRSARLESGRSRLRFFEVPAAASIDAASLQLSIGNGVQVLEPRRGVSNVEQTSLAQFVGRKVTLLRWIGNAEKAVSGTLLSTDPLLLDTPEGVLYNPPGTWVLPKEGIPNAPELTGAFMEWPVNAPQPGDYKPELLYATTGLNWSASYSARLNQTQDRLSFRGWLSIANGTGAAYPAAKLHLSDKEGKKWDWPEPVDISRTGATLLLADAEVPVTRRLTYYNSNFDGDFNDISPNRSVTFQNSKANGLGNYLPTGPATQWHQNEDGHVVFSKGDSEITRRPIAPDEHIGLAFGTDSNIRISRGASSRLLNPVTREWTVVWAISANPMGVERTISLYDYLPADAKFTEKSQEPAENRDRWVRFDITLSPGGRSTVRYVVTSKA